MDESERKEERALKESERKEKDLQGMIVANKLHF